jgi:thiol-disulfide isomerase/thioredoxin
VVPERICVISLLNDLRLPYAVRSIFDGAAGSIRHFVNASRGILAMSLRHCLFSVILFPLASHSLFAEESWVQRGRIVDEQGKPVAGVSVGTIWNANGVSLRQLQESEKDGLEHPELAKNEGRMEPWGDSPVETDPHGCFSIELKSPSQYKLLALDRQRKRGVLLLFKPDNPSLVIEGRLSPLIRAYGQTRAAATGEKLAEQTVVACLPFDEDLTIGNARLVVCSSLESRFEFWLPAGDYEVEVYGHTPTPLELPRRVPFRLPADRTEVNIGTLNLVPPKQSEIEKSKAAETWVDFRERYGQPCPEWHAVDARGVSKDAQIDHFRGKWVLVNFWSPTCLPCMRETLPELRAFYETHQADRDRFEIVAVCSTFESEVKSMSLLDRRIKPVRSSIWKGRELPFPIVLDNTSTTMERFGVDVLGTTLLVDPEGRLVEGDMTTLAEKLKIPPARE